MAEEKNRRIRINVEVYTVNDIPPVYMDLPDGWDDMTAKERDDFLQEVAIAELANHAGSGAMVVDQDDNIVDEEEA